MGMVRTKGLPGGRRRGHFAWRKYGRRHCQWRVGGIRGQGGRRSRSRGTRVEGRERQRVGHVEATAERRWRRRRRRRHPGNGASKAGRKWGCSWRWRDREGGFRSPRARAPSCSWAGPSPSLSVEMAAVLSLVRSSHFPPRASRPPRLASPSLSCAIEPALAEHWPQQ